MKDFEDRVDRAQTLLRKAKASEKLEDFLTLETLLKPEEGVSLSSLDHDELEIYLHARLHVAAITAQTLNPDWESVIERVQEVLQFDVCNAHAHWLRGMCYVKLGKDGAIEELADALGHAKRMALPETPSWEKEYIRLKGIFDQAQPKKEPAKIEELESEEPLQKGFFNRKPSGKSSKKQQASVAKQAKSPVHRVSEANGHEAPSALTDSLVELRDLLRKWLLWREEDVTVRQEQHSEVLALLEERTDRVPEALEAVPAAVEAIRREADEFREIEEKLHKQVSQCNMESIQLKQDVHQVLQDTKKQHSTVLHMKEDIDRFLRDAKQLLEKNSEPQEAKMAKTATNAGAKISVVEIEVAAFKQPKVWIALILSFLAGMLGMLGVVVEVYTAWGCAFSCQR
eukprot:GEMP01036458.1.p1 GENE.GEMP01036458.1~~GEMP01036458.1.p1  ORF type:complete len:399 (+),score=114.71 GEMP01036458.1:35-1231(+)